MSDPRLQPLPPDVARLLARERGAPPPDELRTERVRARIRATIGLAGVAGAGASVATATGETGAGAGGAGTAGTVSGSAGAIAGSAAVAGAKLGLFATKSLVVWIATAAAATSIYGGLKLAGRDATRTDVRAREPVEPRALDEIAFAPAPAPARTPRSDSPGATTPISGSPAPAPPGVERARRDPESRPRAAAPRSTLSDERTLIATARAALARGENEPAIDSLAAHARRFPAGALAEERDALWIVALAKSGQADAARARAERFRERYPHGIQLRSVDAALRSLP